MKQKEQFLYILKELWETNGISVKHLTNFSMNRGIIKKEDEIIPLIEQMRDNNWITVLEDTIHPNINKTEFSKISFTNMAQTFVNGGSHDKMIYNTPNTPFTVR